MDDDDAPQIEPHVNGWQSVNGNYVYGDYTVSADEMEKIKAALEANKSQYVVNGPGSALAIDKTGLEKALDALDNKSVLAQLANDYNHSMWWNGGYMAYWSSEMKDNRIQGIIDYVRKADDLTAAADLKGVSDDMVFDIALHHQFKPAPKVAQGKSNCP